MTARRLGSIARQLVSVVSPAGGSDAVKRRRWNSVASDRKRSGVHCFLRG